MEINYIAPFKLPVSFEDIIAHDEYTPRSLEEIDKSFFGDVAHLEASGDCKATTRQEPPKLKSYIFGFFFYTFIAASVLAFYIMSSGTQGGVPRNFGGFAVMTVISESMQDEIPKDSFVLTRVTPANEIRIGDDITFLRSADTTVTHRVVGIYENHNGTNERAFRTQGIMNPTPDAEVVLATNVIGRVVFTNLPFGRVMTFIGENVIPVGVISALLIGLFIATRYILRSKRQERLLESLETTSATETGNAGFVAI